jgi:hypothetical protein
MRNQYQLLIKQESAPGPTRLQTYDGEECLDVRDLSNRVTMQVRAQEISCYRHTLFLDGKAYRILNVVKRMS